MRSLRVGSEDNMQNEGLRCGVEILAVETKAGRLEFCIEKRGEISREAVELSSYENSHCCHVFLSRVGIRSY